MSDTDRAALHVSRRDLLRLLGLAGGSALAAPLVGCGPQSPTQPSGVSAPPPAPKLAQRMTIGVPAVPPSLDPGNLIQGHVGEAVLAVCEPLVLMVDDKLTPSLATSWKTTDGGTTWEFQLRPNVKFSNGEEFDSQAVVFSYTRGVTKTPPMTAFSRITSAVASIEAIDRLTVRVVAKTPDAILPGRLLDMRIVPPRYAQQVGDDEFGRKPIGTGPYRVTEFRPSDSFTLEAWDGAWRGPSKTKEIVVRGLAEPSARAAAIRTGDVDIVSDISIDSAKQLRTGDTRLVQSDEANVISVFMNPLQESPFKDVRVRQAVRQALNKKLLVDNLFSGFYKPAGGQFVPAVTFGYDPALKDLEFDLAKARQLMSDAGFANGFDMKLTFTTGIAFVNDVAQFVADQVRQIGIRVELESLEFAVYNQRFFANQIGPFQIILSQTAPLLDADLTLQFWLTTSPIKRLANEEFDKALIATRTELDPAKREKLLQRCVQIINEQSVVACLYQTTGIWAASPKVQDFKKAVSTGINVQNITKREA